MILSNVTTLKMINLREKLTERRLKEEARTFAGTGGVSSGNQSHGFEPAFLNTETGVVYMSRHADGTPATCHLIEGLPHELVLERDASGKVTAVKACVICGFVHEGKFYNREEAARLVARLI
jgi:hypothetical protein